MVNILREGGNELVRLDYNDLLTKILTVLQSQQTKNPFNLFKDRSRLSLDLDEIAFQVATLQIENPSGTDASSAKSATVNRSRGSKDYFFKQVQQIRDRLKQLLESRFTQKEQSLSIENYVQALATALTDFQGEPKTLSFTYPFDQPYSGLQKQRLNLQKKKSGVADSGYELTVNAQ